MHLVWDQRVAVGRPMPFESCLPDKVKKSNASGWDQRFAAGRPARSNSVSPTKFEKPEGSEGSLDFLNHFFQRRKVFLIHEN